MTELLWVKIIFLVIGIFAYLGIGRFLLQLTSKKKDLGPAYFWSYLWPLSVVILAPAVVIILVAIVIITILAVGFIATIIGFAGGFLGLIIVLFLAFIALVVFGYLILSPFEGLELFLANVKKLSRYFFTGKHRVDKRD